jgi:predicted enzyme related to lactoylglutathione lyase
MTLTVGSVVFRVKNVARMQEFWTSAVDYVLRDDADDSFALLKPRNGVGPNISLDRWHASLQVPPRIHLDLYAKDQSAEVERLKALGATVVEWDAPADADFVVMADPEGNRFCVIDSSDDREKTPG